MGAKVVMTNAAMVNSGNIVNNSTGNILLTGNWQNDGNYSGESTSVVTINGSTEQSIGGSNPTTFSNLTVDNTAGCSLSETTTVDGTLDFQNGVITTGANSLIIGISGVILNAGSLKYVNGKLSLTFSSQAAKVFPVGKGGNYRPVTFQYTALTGTSVVSAEQFESAMTGTLPSNSYLLTPYRYWEISQSGGSSFQYKITLDGTGISPTYPVVILKKDGSTITANATTSPVYTNATSFSSFSDFALGEQCPTHSISGIASYENNPQTQLSGLKIVLLNGSQPVDSVTTSSSGYYAFNGLSNGTYRLQVKTAHPTGLWQTWAGVNNTDYLIVSNHVAGTTLLPSNPPVIRITANVKTGNPAINNDDALAIRQAAKSGWGFFDIPKWVFSGTTAATPLSDIVVSCADVTRNIKGLCAGDVNGSYVPASGYKQSEPSVELINRGQIGIAGNLSFPIKSDAALNLGAITLMLNYDSDLIDIVGVEMPDHGDNEPWFYTKDNLLYLGWMSRNPVDIEPASTFLTIHARVKDFNAEKIRFTLNENPENELADKEGNALQDIMLSVADAGKTIETNTKSMLSVYPNPANEFLNVEFVMPEQGICHVTVSNLQGISVWSKDITLDAGFQIQKLDISDLAAGAYLIKLQYGNNTEIKKMIIGQ
jgi:hypothetical protein